MNDERVAEIRAAVDQVFDYTYGVNSYPLERQAAVNEYLQMWGDRDKIDIERWLDTFYSNEQRPVGHFIDRCEVRRLESENARLRKVAEAAQGLLNRGICTEDAEDRRLVDALQTAVAELDAVGEGE